MIDLKKSLEGVPGLLVMACCGLVGIAIGFSIALSTEYWIKASDGLANFWGGVVGAGLGAALAVLGAVYIQRRDLEVKLRQPTNSLRTALQGIDRRLIVLKHLQEVDWSIDGALLGIEKDARELPDGAELLPETHDEIVRLKLRLHSLVAMLRSCEAGGEEVEQMRKRVAELQGRLALHGIRS